MSAEGLRIGDAERERAQAALVEHYVAGRLDHDEYNLRLDQVWASRTGADLAGVFTDLPGGGPVAARPAYSTPAARGAVRPTRRGPRLPVPLLVLLVVLVAVTVAANLPLILVGVAAWFLLVRGGCRTPRRRW